MLFGQELQNLSHVARRKRMSACTAELDQVADQHGQIVWAVVLSHRRFIGKAIGDLGHGIVLGFLDDPSHGVA
jgi:hypothetical protein